MRFFISEKRKLVTFAIVKSIGSYYVFTEGWWRNLSLECNRRCKIVWEMLGDAGRAAEQFFWASPYLPSLRLTTGNFLQNWVFPFLTSPLPLLRREWNKKRKTRQLEQTCRSLLWNVEQGLGCSSCMRAAHRGNALVVLVWNYSAHFSLHYCAKWLWLCCVRIRLQNVSTLKTTSRWFNNNEYR